MLKQIRKTCEKASGMLRNQKGQGLVEYALIIVLIALVAMVALKTVGTTTNTTFSKINTGLVNP